VTTNEAFIILNKYMDALEGTELCQALEILSAEVRKIASLMVRIERLQEACTAFTSVEIPDYD